jgi:hypothetical protein
VATNEKTTATSVAATGVRTAAWLGSQNEVAVPVFQRHYRWDVERCRQLLADVRASGVAGRPHFIGSILATIAPGEGEGIVLIDGQQRVATLTLLIAAVRKALAGDRRADRLRDLLVHPVIAERTRLRPHEGQQDVLAGIVFDSLDDHYEPGVSNYEDVYRFFLAEVQADAADVCDALYRLEHVFITLAPTADAQQVFESLNSTGAPLRDHELVHNYVLMGLTYDQQIEIEREHWRPIEASTGEFIDQFFRDYLTQRSGREDELSGEHGIYSVFKTQFPQLSADTVRKTAAEWTSYAEVYGELLDPNRVDDDDIRTRLNRLNTFGTATYPIVMAICHDYRHGSIDKNTVTVALDGIEALYLRRMVVGESRDRLAAQLCRRLRKSGYPIRDIVRRSPSDERVRNALKYRPVPHVGYVLQRLDGLSTLGALHIEHIFPQAPGTTWSGDGQRLWSDFSEEERARLLALLNTLGNLVLLEPELNIGAGNRPFDTKRGKYAQSRLGSVLDLCNLDAWDAEAIEQRTATLTERFLATWPRPTDIEFDDTEHLVPILDAEKKAGWYPGWRNEFSYVTFRGEIWEVHDLKTLFNRVFKSLWAERRADVIAYCATHDGPVFETEAWPSQWDALDGSHFLFMGLFPQYMLGELQSILDEFGIAEDVLVKYAAGDS